MSALWTLEQGVSVARKMEKILIPLGCHCCLGGSVLHAGQSDKDLDIFIYPDKQAGFDGKAKRSEIEAKFIEEKIAILASVPRKDDGPVYWDKQVTIAEFNGRRIDLFFVTKFI